MNMERTMTTRALKTSQRLNAFNLGNIISQEHNIIGNRVLANPPIRMGMIIKGVINIP